MTRTRVVLQAVATVLLAPLMALVAAPAQAKDHPTMMLGPGDAHVSNIKDKALIRWSRFGYVYIAGQQSSHLTITFDKDTKSLTYLDTRTKHLGPIPKTCTRLKTKRGIGATCRITKRFEHRKMFVQVWPRLGNDWVDARTLPKKFRLWALMDAGNDTVYGGAGNDFVNAAFDNDWVYGGPGNDLLRGGPGNDHIWGGKGHNRLSCAEGYDVGHHQGRDSYYMCDKLVRV